LAIASKQKVFNQKGKEERQKESSSANFYSAEEEPLSMQPCVLRVNDMRFLLW